jgi:hypothetical protein
LLRPLTSGLQDERLKYSAQPNPAQFTKVFVRAGRLTTQWVRLDFNQIPAFGTTTTVDLIRKGHFITRLFLVTTLPDIAAAQLAAQTEAGTSTVAPKFAYTNDVGHALVANAEMTITGAVVDRLNSQLLELIDEFGTPLEKVPAVDRLIGRMDTGYSPTTGLAAAPTITVPLPFWFSRGDSGCALPIDAMGSDLVQLRMTFRAFNGLFYTDSRSPAVNPLIDGSALWPLAGSTLYKSDTAGSIVPGLDTLNPSSKWSPLTTKMPTSLSLGETYILAEYVYVDRPEANKFRLADLQIPVVQHYVIEPFDTQTLPEVQIPIRVPNPTKTMYIYPRRYEASAYNAHFLATRDLSGAGYPLAPWWPNAVGLGGQIAPRRLIPAFALQDSEPIAALTFAYEANFARWATQSPALFRSIVPGTAFSKSPWVNRYLYAIPFGLNSPLTVPNGEANLDKLRRSELRIQLSSQRGCLNPMQVDRYWLQIFVENYNVLRVYGGRGSMLFTY